jgi:hypothetical protein
MQNYKIILKQQILTKKNAANIISLQFFQSKIYNQKS